MSDNKVKGQLDFSNIKMSQFGMGNVIRASFSELQSALRITNTNALLKDAYTHFIQELDVNNNPTKIEYYQASQAVIDEIFFIDDVAGSLQGKYIVVQEFISKREIALYVTVDGVGTAPTAGDLQVAVNISENDPASIVRLAFITALGAYESFQVERVGKYTESSIKVTYLQFGETEAIDLTDTGFTVNRIQSGDSFKVGEVIIEYDEYQNPIWDGNLLKGMVYNAFTGEFESAGAGAGDLKSTTPNIQNIDLTVPGTIYPVTIEEGALKMLFQSRNDATLEFSFEPSFSSYITLPRGTTYSEDDLNLTGKTMYIRTKKTTVLELLQWT